jgi:hypothetical protein
MQQFSPRKLLETMQLGHEDEYVFERFTASDDLGKASAFESKIRTTVEDARYPIAVK